jgi:hypothetical protein
VATTPQAPQRILLPADSAILSLTDPTVTTASCSGATDKANDTPKKGNLRKRKFPDFSCAFSQDNALLSGNESDRWDNKLPRIPPLPGVTPLVHVGCFPGRWGWYLEEQGGL